jgi:SH3-like domain-containing protein
MIGKTAGNGVAALLFAAVMVMAQAAGAETAGETSMPDLTGVAGAAPVIAPIVQPQAAAEASVVPVLATPAHDPNRGSVTNLPLPRYVTLKNGEGNARRGPGLTHRIDWVFTRVGMPLRITAEYEHWRRVEDAEGAGGWVHYSLLSGVRSVLLMQDMAGFHARPQAEAEVIAQAELGVVARLLECQPDWCRIAVDGEKGWVAKTALWGVDAGEVIE